MAKYRKVYEADFQSVLNVICMFDIKTLRSPTKALTAIKIVFPVMLQFFECLANRPVLEDDE